MSFLRLEKPKEKQESLEKKLLIIKRLRVKPAMTKCFFAFLDSIFFPYFTIFL